MVRDPRIYSRAQQGEVYCFRDNVGLEAGAIIERHDGAWIAVEAKLSPSAASVDRAARSLLRLRSKVAALRWFVTPSPCWYGSLSAPFLCIQVDNRKLSAIM